MNLTLLSNSENISLLIKINNREYSKILICLYVDSMIKESYNVTEETELVKASLNGDKKAFRRNSKPLSENGCTYS